MEFKGTKGEWNIKNVVDEKSWINITSEKDILARVFFGDAPPIINKNEAIANAKLIASAPDLLDATKELLGLLEFHGYKNSTEIYKAQQAINKALN